MIILALSEHVPATGVPKLRSMLLPVPDWSCMTEFSRERMGNTCTRGEFGPDPAALYTPFTLESTGVEDESMRTANRESLCTDCLLLARMGVWVMVGVVAGLASTVNGSVSRVMTTAGGGGCILGLDMARNAAARLERELSSPKTILAAPALVPTHSLLHFRFPSGRSLPAHESLAAILVLTNSLVVPVSSVLSTSSGVLLVN